MEYILKEFQSNLREQKALPGQIEENFEKMVKKIQTFLGNILDNSHEVRGIIPIKSQVFVISHLNLIYNKIWKTVVSVVEDHDKITEANKIYYEDVEEMRIQDLKKFYGEF